MNKRFHTWLTIWGIGAAAVLTALTLTTATYAWFTANRKVETDVVTSRSGSIELDLQVSRKGGKEFTPEKDKSGVNVVPLKGSEELPLTEEIVLMPVSTADLKTFVYSPMTNNGYAEDFLPVEGESLYYHDTIYLKAVAQGVPESARMALYLDNSDKTPIVRAEDGELLTAARLGLRFDGGKPVILTLSDINEGTGNSRPGGVPLESGQVLTWKDGGAAPAKDPAIRLADAQIPKEGGAAKQPLATLELNRVYAVDIYFYLEGCDPDCLSDRVGLDAAKLNLALFGQLTY